MLDSVALTDFKQIQRAKLELGPINVLVGGNNSGKSCVLQGIHFGIALSQSRLIAGAEQFPAERLRYCPTDDFLDLRHSRRLTEGASVDFRYTRLTAGAPETATVRLERGRNGVVKAVTRGGQLQADIADPRGFFSIYVPGLAGISIREEYRSELVVDNGIARGDANLYLRNVLLRINRKQQRLERFTNFLQKVFPGVSVHASFDEANDLWIKAFVRLPDGATRPLDMVGTGLLQAIQLIAYVCNYEPKVLLLDEPDAHLHPSNQRLLAETLSVIAATGTTKIVLATHSRHLLDSLSENPHATLYWVKSGAVTKQENWSDIAVLLDLGALDKGERFLAGNYRFLLWTEDQLTSNLETLLTANNISMDEVMVFSYQASSKVDAAKLMAAFVERVRPGVRTIVHRDRDFMTDDEVQRLRAKYKLDQTPNMRLFITKGSDVESYYCVPEHLASVMNVPAADARTLVESTLGQNMVQFVLEFREKRENIKRELYKADPENCPSTNDLMNGNQVPIEQASGKVLLKLLLPQLQARGINGGAVCVQSPALNDLEVQGLFAN